MNAAAPASGQVRQQQRIESLCVGTIRALSGQPDLQFRGHRLHQAGRPLPLFAPHLHPRPDTDDFRAFRGAADGLALRLLHSDAALHRQLAPASPVERLLFDLLEQNRCEALAGPALPGVSANLRQRFEGWARGFCQSGLADSMRGILLFTVTQITRARVTGDPVPQDLEDLMEATRAGIVPQLGHDLAGLRRQRHDQASYALHALAIASQVARLLLQEHADDEDTGASQPEDIERAAFSLVMDLDASVEEGVAAADTGLSRVLGEHQGQYRVYTRAYDRVLAAQALVRPEVLREDRALLDRRVAEQAVNLPRLARELRALLADPADDGWESGQEQGRVDGRRLARLVASPTERRLFRTEQRTPLADCQLTLLIDCSGSMKQHIETVAVVADVLCRALELAGVSSEVLGFTTGAWHGGRAQRDWIRRGRPPQPGRLNEVCHLIFKPAETPWRRSRAGLGALLRPELFREGIDGEAVQWACQRLRERPQARKLLLVVSDGCPMDGATGLANDTYYLDNHLKAVVEQETRQGDIQIFGIGVGLDLSPFYPRSLALDLQAAPGNSLFRELLELLATGLRR
ncbi:MAG: cobalt chelatase [Rhodoferax sp.]|nr:cobalt chelatase [Rhodoferax sp.]